MKILAVDTTSTIFTAVLVDGEKTLSTSFEVGKSGHSSLILPTISELMDIADTKPEDLDDHVDARLPVDVIARFAPNLKPFGVTPALMVTYRKACTEGWAPAPTNDIQKAIWEKEHAIPKNPMKIEFDPKKGR